MPEEMKNALQDLFPGDHPITPHVWVAPLLGKGEIVVWQGTRERTGEYSIGRKLIGLVLMIVAVIVVARFAGISLEPLLSLMDSGNPVQLMIPIGVLVALFVFGIVRARRNPSEEWAYAVTNQRLLTFYKGQPVRVATPDDVERFAARRGVEDFIRGTGDVTWALGTENKGNHGGPDHGRHGFLAIKNPVAMRDRLKQWRGLVYDHGDVADLAFSQQVNSATTASAQPEETLSGLTVINRRHQIALTVPKHWTGRMAIRETERLKVLGVELPVPILAFNNEAHLPNTTEDWNYLELDGLGDATFELEIVDGPIPTTYAAEMQALEEKGHSGGIIQSSPELKQGALSGFAIVFDLNTGTVSLDSGVVRRVWLGNDEFHLSIYAKIKASDAGAQSEAMDAIVASIRSI